METEEDRPEVESVVFSSGTVFTWPGNHAALVLSLEAIVPLSYSNLQDTGTVQTVKLWILSRQWTDYAKLSTVDQCYCASDFLRQWKTDIIIEST